MDFTSTSFFRWRAYNGTHTKSSCATAPTGSVPCMHLCSSTSNCSLDGRWRSSGRWSSRYSFSLKFWKAIKNICTSFNSKQCQLIDKSLSYTHRHIPYLSFRFHSKLVLRSTFQQFFEATVSFLGITQQLQRGDATFTWLRWMKYLSQIILHMLHSPYVHRQCLCTEAYTVSII